MDLPLLVLTRMPERSAVGSNGGITSEFYVCCRSCNNEGFTYVPRFHGGLIAFLGGCLFEVVE